VASRLEFASLEFENGKSDILLNMQSDLTKVLDFLIDHPSFKLNVSGHTDSSGDALLNLTLSQRRADAIKNWIVEGGVESTRINAIGYGSNQPIIVEERTEDDMALNRRVEFEIYREAIEDGNN
jgi:outer membrane protein OmpA-like peptidoglycan-associated protein